MNPIASLYDPAYHDGIVAVAILIGTIVVALLIQRLVFALLERTFARTSDGLVAALLHRAAAPSGFAFPLMAALIAIPELRFPKNVDAVLVKITAVSTVIAIAWAIVAAIGLYADLVKAKFRVDVTDNLHARQVETRIDLLGRAAVTIVVLVALALAAMVFPSVRAIGTTLLASAGAAGIVIGIAARPLFENLIAGVQLALAQPIRIDDVVFVQGESGHVEQIASTYVVVRLWDQRRMILPLTYFIEQPFQNWTRTGAALLGTVMLYVDYATPIQALREHLPKVLEGEKLWDGAVQSLQVTDAKEGSVEVRIVVSARNSEDLFDLRCRVREAMVAFYNQTRAAVKA